MRLLLAAVALAGMQVVAGCGDTGSSGSTNVQGGTGRAPQPGGQATVRPTATAAR